MENVSRRWPRGNRSRLYSESTARSVNPRIMRESSFSRACRWWWYIDNGPQVGQQRSDKSSSRGSSTPSSSSSSLSFLSATQQCLVEALLYGRLRSSPRLVNDFRLATNLPRLATSWFAWKVDVKALSRRRQARVLRARTRKESVTPPPSPLNSKLIVDQGTAQLISLQDNSKLSRRISKESRKDYA